MKRTAGYLIMLMVLLAQPYRCFAENGNDVAIEEYLSAFGAQETKEAVVIERYNTLTETAEAKGGIIQFDVSENGNVVIICGDRDYLILFNDNMDEIYQFEGRFIMESVALHDDKILLFSGDNTCGLYDLNGNLLKAYELTNLYVDDGIYNHEAQDEYRRLTRRNVKQVGEYNYYLSNSLKKIPSDLGDYKNQYRYLVKADKDGNATILLDRKEVVAKRFALILYSVTCILLTVIGVYIIYRIHGTGHYGRSSAQ